MKIRLNPLLLGAFVTGAVVIVICALLGLGTISFHPISHFVMYLPRSTSGVSQGTAVNLAGVRVGEVQSVRVFYNHKTHHSVVAVICVIKRSLLTDLDGQNIPITDENTFKKMVSQGLFAQIQTSGLVGAKYVELAFGPSSPPIQLPETPNLPYTVVPSVPSTMSKLSGTVSDLISNLGQIDFSNTIHEINTTLASARRQINDLHTGRLANNVSTAAKSFGTFMNSSDLRRTVTQLQTAAANFQNLVTNLNAQVQPAGTNLVATLDEARKSAQELNNLLGLRNQLGEQTHDLLDQLNQTARAIERLADFLQRHPNALITGRTQPSSDSH